MKKTVSVVLAVYIIVANLYAMFSCSAPDADYDTPPSYEPPSEPNKPESTVVVPVYKDYERGTVNFSELKYERPDIQSVVNAFNNITETVKENSKDFESQRKLIEDIEADYSKIRTMYTLAEIKNRIDSSDEFWLKEYEYMSLGYPSFTQAVEDMFVACAQSEHKERFEAEYFMASLDSYVDGGIYTDRVVELMATEASLEAEYSSISTATVKISFAGETDTVDNILGNLADSYGESSAVYKAAKGACMESYHIASKEISRPIFVELIRVRRLIADELLQDSYSEYAYEAMGHDYSPEETKDFLSDIKEYVYPVFSTLYTRVFYEYFKGARVSEQGYIDTVNSLYELYGEENDALFDIYSYMLQHGLYDIDSVRDNRYEGAFTTYLELNNSPFLFMSADGYTTDYLTLAHEFGHFADGYINYGSSASLDLQEVSSQALELLTLSSLKGRLSDKDYQYLEYYECYSALNVLLMQGFYSAFEHFAYELEYDEITEENLNKAVEDASIMIFGEVYYDDIDYVMIPHTVLYPYYVQSYCTSITAALEIFFTEVNRENAGFDIYIDLITRDSDEYLTFPEELASVGLTSPLEDDYLKKISDAVYYHILGSHYHYGKNFKKAS